MHIAFVAHNFVRGNGQGRIQLEIVRRALVRGHAVTLLANRIEPDLMKAGVVWHPVRPLPRRPALLSDYMMAAAADRALPQFAAVSDVIVGAGYTLRLPHDVSLCQFVHGAWLRSPVHVSRLDGGPYGAYQRLYTTANARWERQAYAAARRIVAPSQKIRAELISIGVPDDRIAVVYNGVDTDEFHPPFDAAAKTLERAALGIPPDRPLALFVGEIRTPRKNLDTVLKALVQVPNARLAVVGELAHSPFPALARQLGVGDRVHFIGYTLDVQKYMRAADLFVFPSRYEAGTLVLMEAAATGLPIVTARTAGGAEVFGLDAATVIENPDDVSALVAAIRQFADSPQQRALAGAIALAVGRQHTWARMADAYLDLFAEAARARQTIAKRRVA